ncbi:MAG: MraY family glycosyltransferase [Phormidesmis sp.]
MTICWIYITVCMLSLGMVLLITPLVKSIALIFRKLDAPSARKVHQQPMVRLGGAAIFGATTLSLACLGFTDATVPFSAEALSTVLILLLGGGGFFLVGFADDLFDLSAFNRLWMQSAIAAILWCYNIRIETLALPGWETVPLGGLSLPITVIWLVGVVNAVNWMDGLDGLATGVSGISTIVLVALSVAMAQPVPALVGSALLGSLTGFLYYNYNPAKIFMGDGGSYFIGFMLASLCIAGPQQLDSPFATLLPLIILAVPLGDMAGVIFTRIYCKSSPFSADNRHLHHRLLQLQLSHRATVWVMYALSLTVSSLAFVLLDMASPLMFFAELTALISFFTWQVWRAVTTPDSESDVVVRKELWYSENL